MGKLSESRFMKMLDQRGCNMMIKDIILLWLFALTNITYISAETCGTNGVHWSNTFINSGVNNLIIGTSAPSNSVLRCSILCSESSQHASLYYSSALQQCHCNTQLDGTVNITTVDTGLIYGIREKFVQKDRLGLYQQGIYTDGVYVIYPVCGVPVKAWCDMTGGGWTVIQRRQDGSENFYRTWNDYVSGFGNRSGEYWLGLESMRIMTTEASTLRIELETFGDMTPVSAIAEYSNFAIGSSASDYQLTVSGYSGSCGDSLAWHNGMKFSTPDHDNDNTKFYSDYFGNCAITFKGAWWYNSCHGSNLNGMYLGGVTASYADGINWSTCWGFYYSVKTSVMKIRRNM